MDNRKFMQVAVKAVTDYHNATNDAACDKITEDDVFIVWACKTIGNNKAMLATMSETACITNSHGTARRTRVTSMRIRNVQM